MYHEQLPGEVPSWRQSVAAGCLAAASLLSVCTFAEEAIQQVRGQQCSAPSEAALKKVTTLFDSPSPEPDAAADAKLGHRRAYRDFYARRIAELGITFPKYDSHHLDSLEIDLNQNQSKGFGEYYSALSAILNELGIPLKTGPVEGMGLKAQTPTNAELQTSQAKFQTLHLARIFNKVPINLTKRLGITQVALTAHGEGFGGLALTDEGVLIVDVTNNGEERLGVAEHEYEHLIDAAECGADGMQNDPAYESLNRRAKYAGEYPLPQGFLNTVPRTWEALSGKIYPLKDAMQEAAKKRDAAKGRQSQKALEALENGIEVESDYGYKNVGEDKAELGSHIFDPPSYGDVLDKISPVRRAKFLLLLARLYELAPEVVEYYSLNASRPQTPTDWNVVPLKKAN